MALTLTEGNKYSQTELQKAIVDRLVIDDPSGILDRLQFKTILGNSLTYDTVTTRSGAGFYSVGDTWAESTPVLGQDTAALTILGGDADVDNFLKATRSNIIDVQKEVLNDKVLAVRETFLDQLFYGSTAVNAKGFNGLHLKIASTTYNTVERATGGASQTGSVKGLKSAIDLIVGHKPSLIVMSKVALRDLSAYLDSIGSAFPTSRDNYGKTVKMFDGIPVFACDYIVNTEAYSGTSYSAKTGGTLSTTVFILTFAPTACCGIQGPNGVETIKLGDLETKDASRVRIRWYCGFMFQDLRSSAKYSGVTAGTTWGA